MIRDRPPTPRCLSNSRQRGAPAAGHNGESSVVVISIQ